MSESLKNGSLADSDVFEFVYAAWRTEKLTQTDAARLLGVSPRTFRRWVGRYRNNGLAGLKDRRRRPSPFRASQSEVDGTVTLYKMLYSGWNVQHFYDAYRTEHGGLRSYTWVKDRLHEAGLVAKRCQMRSRRPATGDASDGRLSGRVEGSVIYQYSLSDHWNEGSRQDLVLAVDGASGRVYSGFLVERGDLWSVFRSVESILGDEGRFTGLEVDGSLLRLPNTDERFGPDAPRGQLKRAMAELGIDVSFEPSIGFRARFGVVVRTLRDRLPKEIAKAKINGQGDVDTFLRGYWSSYNAQFAAASATKQCAFERLTHGLKENLQDVLCIKRRVRIGEDGCVRYGRLCLRIPELGHRAVLERAEIQVHQYENGLLVILKDGKRLVMVLPDGRQMPVGRAIGDRAP